MKQIIILAWCSNYALMEHTTHNIHRWISMRWWSYNKDTINIDEYWWDEEHTTYKIIIWTVLPMFYAYICIHNNNSRLMLELLLPVFVSSKNLEPIKLNSFTNVWWWLYWSYNIHRWISMRWWSYNKDTINIDEYWWDEEHTTYTDEYRISMRMGHTTSVLPMFH